MAEMQRWVCGASAAWWGSRGARGLVGCVASACAARRPGAGGRGPRRTRLCLPAPREQRSPPRLSPAVLGGFMVYWSPLDSQSSTSRCF